MSASSSPSGRGRESRPDVARVDDPRGGTWGRRLGGWRVGLRLARRDIARHRWSSALVAATIGIPVLLLVAALTVGATGHVDRQEDIPSRFGSAQAVVDGRSRYAVRQLPEADHGWCGGTTGDPVALPREDVWATPAGPTTAPRHDCPGTPPAAPLPGLPPAPTRDDVARSLARLTGGRAVPIRQTMVSVVGEGRRDPVPVLELDGSDPAFRGMVELRTGRWPTRPGEIAVTQIGPGFGLPPSGPTRLAEWGEDGWGEDAPSARPAAVVGVVDVTVGVRVTPAVIRPLDPALREETAFLIDRSTPMGWDEVRSLNRHGLVVASREAIAHPPDPTRLDPRLVDPSRGTSGSEIQAAALLGVLLLVEACLLAGPAFAGIAQRRRRDLALSAANGATRAHLRRVLLAEALLLGAASVLTGLVIGLAAAPAAMAVHELISPTRAYGPFDVPVTQVAIIVAFAILAALVSALLPAQGLSRIDLAGALRGSGASARPGRRRIVPPLLLLGAGVAAYALQLALDLRRVQTGPWLAVAGVIALVGGAVWLAPALLRALAALGRRLPLAWRLATRDADRQRRRTVPAVAAVLGGAMLLAAWSIVATSYDDATRSEHRPVAPRGHVVVEAAPHGRPAAEAALRTGVPGVRVRTLGRLSPRATGAPATVGLAVFPAGCTPAVLQDASILPPPAGSPCDGFASTADILGGESSILVATPQDAADLYGLPADAVEALRRGGIVVDDPRLAPGGSAAVVPLHGVGPGAGGMFPFEISRGGVALGAAAAPLPISPSGVATHAIVAPATAARLGAVDRPSLVGQAPAGEVTTEQERAVRAALSSDSGQVQVERGPELPGRMLGAFVVPVVAALIVVATVSATALGMVELVRDLRVLAAVGAGRRLRRRVAAAQAATLAATGMLLGYLVGAVPATSFVVEVLSGVGRSPQEEVHLRFDLVAVPWPTLTVALLATALLAALVAAALVGRDHAAAP